MVKNIDGKVKIETNETSEDVVEPEKVEIASEKTPSDPVKKLQKENQALREQANRALADYQNLERRLRSERAATVEFARGEVFEALLQPLEHLDLAAKTLKDQGLDMVVKQFWDVLGEQGLSMITPVGEKFDAQTMEAVEKVGEGETVKEVVMPGFMLGTRCLRPAKVKVG